ATERGRAAPYEHRVPARHRRVRRGERGRVGAMNRVRPLVADDIPAVAALHASVFSESSELSTEERQHYLRQVFLESPWHGQPLSSLVSEDEHDGVVGFLGVVPRPMSLNGRSITVAVGSQFMVAPHHRGLGIKLLKTFLSGPQHLSITDGASRV